MKDNRNQAQAMRRFGRGPQQANPKLQAANRRLSLEQRDPDYNPERSQTTTTGSKNRVLTVAESIEAVNATRKPQPPGQR